MKITCRWCGGSKHCHKIGRERITDYDSGFGTDRVTRVRVKIHKHHKGNIHCKADFPNFSIQKFSKLFIAEL